MVPRAGAVSTQQLVGDIHVHAGSSQEETAEIAASAVRTKILSDASMRGAVRKATRSLFS